MWLHRFVCKKAPGKTIAHHALNVLTARGFSSAGVPVAKQRTGLFRSDGKHPDELNSHSMAKLQGALLGRDSHLLVLQCRWRGWDDSRTRQFLQGGKNASLDGRCMFVPTAFENLGAISSSMSQLLSNLGRRLAESSAESHKTGFPFRRCS